MTTVLISLISEQAMPNVMAPLLINPRPDIIKCILPTDPRDRSRKDSQFVSVYQGVQQALAELGFSKVRDRGPVPPYEFEEIKRVCAQIRQEHPGATFIYNITGGTKLMAEAALADARTIQAEAVYVDTENSRLVTLAKDGSVTSERYKSQSLKEITGARYLQAYGVTIKEGTTESPADPWLALARSVATTDGGPALMRFLVESPEPSSATHSEKTWEIAELTRTERTALEQLASMASSTGAYLRRDSFTWALTRESKDFIWRRHWLEWYTFDCIKRIATENSAWHPPQRNVKIVWPGWERSLSHDNELDVTTIHGGRLLICECKAGKDAPTADNIYKLQVVGYKAGTFADKVLVTAQPYLTLPGKRNNEEQVVRALTLGILLVDAETLPCLPEYLQDVEHWLYEQQAQFGLRGN